MQLKDVQVFLTAATTQNLRAAADQLGVSQPAVSKAIRRLEDSLGGKVFERTARGVALTPVGEVLRERGQALQLMVGEIRTRVGDLHAGESGLVRLGTIPTVLPSVVTPMLSRLTAGEPPARFDVHVQLSSELLRQLAAGTLDLALAAMPPSKPEDLSWVVIGTLRNRVAVARTHPLARRAFTLAELAEQPWVLPTPDVAQAQWLAGVFRQSGLAAPRSAVQTDASPVMFRDLVRNSQLLTVLTEESAAGDVGQGLVALPSPAPVQEVQLALFWRRSAFFSVPMQRCRAELRRSFASAKLAR